MDNSSKIDLILASRLINAEMTITALKELLVNSGAANQVEIEAKIAMVRERDYERLKDAVLGPILELEKVSRENQQYNESFGEHKSDPNKPW